VTSPRPAADKNHHAALGTVVVLQSQIPVAEQRLIYKGRVLKDEQTVEALGACLCGEVPCSKKGRHVRGASGARVSTIATALVTRHLVRSRVRPVHAEPIERERGRVGALKLQALFWRFWESHRSGGWTLVIPSA
jgi:hypothetical protein